jgi:hypothetical protein
MQANVAANVGAQRNGTIQGVTGGGSDECTVQQAAYVSTDSITISPSSKSAAGNGETFTLTVTANRAWTLTIYNSNKYVTLSQTSGSAGTTTVTVTSKPNLSLASRGVSVVGNAGTASATCNITQLRATIPNNSIGIYNDVGFDAEVIIVPNGHSPNWSGSTWLLLMEEGVIDNRDSEGNTLVMGNMYTMFVRESADPGPVLSIGIPTLELGTIYDTGKGGN